MKRISLFTIIFICIASLIAGCNDREEKVLKENLLGAIMVDGDIWICTGDEVPAEIDESAIIGEIISTVGYYQTPTENGQANFEIVGSKYARYEDNIVALIDNKWTLFIKEKDWYNGITIQYDCSLEKEIFGDLSQEEIVKLLGKIAKEIKKDKNYEDNIDSIIKNVFREFGINESSNLDVAKSSLKITISDSK
ncbi:hypothetical protein [Tissierella praeacuta]|uniref:hypothetical protein n=1 Tax=Tissierella praeacuta TaxID=43131 RepID=UPI00333F052C